MKHITLCADDYGQNESISQAIITLLEKKRLSATSCMTTSSLFSKQAKWLQPFNQQAQIGLHFNLTEGDPLSSELAASHGFMPLGKLLLRAHSRILNASAIEAELNAQLDAFESAMGQPPVFVDGHQHVHQLPVIRDVLFHVYEQRLRQHACYIRSVHTANFVLNTESYYVKRLIIHTLSASRSFKLALLKRNIPHNRSFAGIYQFNDSAFYAKLFPGFLRQITDQGIIMCHPGLGNDEDGDLINKSRYDEFSYFNSQQFISDCHLAGIVL
jgi:predicted glycoside hydrolase/deacetylase ChbG (UPF0249 family)